MRSSVLVFTFCVGLSLPWLVIASDPQNEPVDPVEGNQKPITVTTKDNKKLGWGFYHSDPKPKPIKKLNPPPPTPTPSAKPQEVIEPFSVQWFQKNYSVIEARAIDNPTKENIRAELFASRVMMDKSETYARNRRKAQANDPYLQEGTRLPAFGRAMTALKMERKDRKEEAIKQVFERAGLFVFYDKRCKYCQVSVPLINLLTLEYPDVNLTIFTKGGDNNTFIPKLFPSIKVLPASQSLLPQTLDIDFYPTFVLVNPPNDFYIVSQGTVPKDELYRRILSVAFETKILDQTWYELTHPEEQGLIQTDEYQKLAKDMNNDPTKMINAVMDMIDSSSGKTLYDYYQDEDTLKNKQN